MVSGNPILHNKCCNGCLGILGKKYIVANAKPNNYVQVGFKIVKHHSLSYWVTNGLVPIALNLWQV